MAVKQAESDFYPLVTASASTGTGRSLNSSNWSPTSDFSVGASYSFTPSSIANYQSIKKQRISAEYLFQQTVNDITSNVSVLYIKALYAQKKSVIAQNNLEYQQLKLREIEEFRSAGKKSVADILQQKTIVAESEASLLEAQQEFGSVMLSIYDVMGIALDSKQSPDTAELSYIVNRMLNQDSMITELNISAISQFQSDQQGVAAAELQVKSAQMSYLPSISGSLSSGLGYGGSSQREPGWSEPAGKVSLSLSYPIFDKFKRKENVGKAVLNLQSARLQLQENQKSAQLKYRQALYSLEIAKKKLEVADTRLIAAKQSLEAINIRYEAGASTLAEVAMVNNSFLNAVNSRLQQETAIVLAVLNLMSEGGQIYTFVEKFLRSK